MGLVGWCVLWLATVGERSVQADLLVVGGSESGVAAAVAAARLGVRSIVLVNDIDWLGGQFTAEGLGAVDEWTSYRNQRVPFPRSGIFLEVMDRIEEDMVRKYGLARPGNCFCAWTTCEPRDTERIFRSLVAPYLAETGGPVRLALDYEPNEVLCEGDAVVGARFVSTRGEPPLTVRARLTIDASDWGDVVRLSGAEYFCGPDLRSRFGEPSAPEDFERIHPNEMNPITYCLVLREAPSEWVVPPPEHFEPRSYFGTSIETRAEFEAVGWPRGVLRPSAPAWKDTELPGGPYSGGPSVYHHRRLVDRRHHGLAPGTEAILVNWPLQDYPTYDFPMHVVQALDATEPGAAQKNLVQMTPTQRRIVFEDAKRHALGMLHHLQTRVHEKDPASPVGFRSLRLTEEFGTADRLPKKPYVREGLRTRALYVLREHDIRDTDGVIGWAPHMVPDSVFGFQFSIDFHPSRRVYLAAGDRSGPWGHIHSDLRHWGTHSDRAGFPLRGLVPATRDGLVVAGKNLGMTSIVSAAVRLHGHGMHVGQAAGSVAAVCLAEEISPRQLARNWPLVRRVQAHLLEPSPSLSGSKDRPRPGVLLWPYHDVPPDAPWFAAANHLALRGIYVADRGSVDFEAHKGITHRELAGAIVRAALATGTLVGYENASDEPSFEDVPASDPDFAAIQTAAHRRLVLPSSQFQPDAITSIGLIRRAINRLGWTLDEVGLDQQTTQLDRGRFVLLLWRAIRNLPDLTGPAGEPQADADSDADGAPDLEDPLPFDRDDDGLADRLDPHPQRDRPGER